MKRMSGLVNSKFPLPGLRKGGCPTLIPLLRFTELVDKQYGAGFSLRGTSVPLERRAGTRGRRAEAPPQAEARPTFCHSILRTSIIFFTIWSAVSAQKLPFDAQALMKVARISDPQLAPDGRTVAFTVQTVDLEGNKKPKQIYTVPMDGGGSPRQITTAGSANERARWSPDSKRIAFISDRGGSSQVWIMNADGSA